VDENRKRILELAVRLHCQLVYRLTDDAQHTYDLLGELINKSPVENSDQNLDSEEEILLVLA
jgi:hypothetical protein